MAKVTLTPKEGKFLELFVESVHNIVDAAQKLKELAYVWDNIEYRVAAITDLEHEGNNITHKIITESHDTFFTSFNREDISHLARSLRDVTHFIYSTADFMFIYRIQRPTRRFQQLADAVVEISLEMEKAISLLTKNVDQSQILEHCVEIHRMEKASVGIYSTALTESFADTADERLLIKCREIYEQMEIAINKSKDVANAIEGWALKYI